MTPSTDDEYSLTSYTGRPVYKTAKSWFHILDVLYTGISYTGQNVWYSRKNVSRTLEPRIPDKRSSVWGKNLIYSQFCPIYEVSVYHHKYLHTKTTMTPKRLKHLMVGHCNNQTFLTAKVWWLNIKKFGASFRYGYMQYVFGHFFALAEEICHPVVPSVLYPL